VLYNGLNLNEFKPDIDQRNDFRNQHGFDNDALLIGIAGSINPDKGQLELIKLFNQLAVNSRNIKLVIAGNFASQFPQHTTLIKQAIINQPNIAHVGFIKDTPAFYNGCDIIINNSNDERSESLGTTIYEAMACKKLVIASATGGTPEIIADKVEGLLFAPGNNDELLNLLSYAIKNYEALNDIREAAREKVISRFNIETMAAEYNRIIKNL
jgi:glycosyltransferase involved in cell wall biosynthesis